MTDSQPPRRLWAAVVLSLPWLLLLSPAAATASSDYRGAQPRFLCTPVPADADPACFPSAGGSAPVGGPSGGAGGHQSASSAGWWGASEEAKATILHLRESLVQQKETILDQRETIRELTAKLTLCEGLGRGAAAPPAPPPSHPHYYAGVAGHHADHSRHYGSQPGHHSSGNLIPDSPHQPSDGGHQAKDKHVTAGDVSSSPEQMERMLLALKERLDNLQVSAALFKVIKCTLFLQHCIHGGGFPKLLRSKIKTHINIQGEGQKKPFQK